MATTTSMSVTEELLASITEPFTKVVCVLDTRKIISDEIMNTVRKKLGNRHWIDMNRFCQGRHTKPQGIYELFGEYFDKNQVDVRHELLQWIKERTSEIEDNIRIALRHKNLSMETWLSSITDLKCPADELVIYCLAKKYYKHVVIYTATYSWSTLARHFSYTKEQIRDKCQIQLILRGPCRYAEIRLIGMPRSQSNPAVDAATTSMKDEEKAEIANSSSDATNNTDKTRKLGVKYKIVECVISASNIIPTERKHNTRDSNRQNKRTSSKPLRSSRKNINYAKLNDGLDPFSPPSPKRQKRHSYRPSKDGPSEQLMSSHVQKEKENKALDLEQIMDTTLDEDITTSNNSIDSSMNSECSVYSTISSSEPNTAGVTEMDGVSNELPEINSEHVNPTTENKLDGVLEVNNQNNVDNMDVDGVTDVNKSSNTPALLNEQCRNLPQDTVPTGLPTNTEQDMSMDGGSLLLGSELHSDSVTASAEPNPSISSNVTNKPAMMDGVTVSTKSSSKLLEQGNQLHGNETSSIPVVQSAGVTPGTSISALTSETTTNDLRLNEITSNLENTVNEIDTQPGTSNDHGVVEPDSDCTLDGVTADQSTDMVNKKQTEVSTQKTIGEIIYSNEFPEKTLLLGGVTYTKLNNGSEITNSANTSTLPDLVSSNNNNNNNNHNDNNNHINEKISRNSVHAKSPTERLLDVFGSPIPSEIEDAEIHTELRNYDTTEDEDDAIDGLLALSNSSQSEKSRKKNENLLQVTEAEKDIDEGKTDKPVNSNKGSKKQKKQKNSKKRKRENTEKSEAADHLEKQMKDMNIAGRKSRSSQKSSKSTTPKNFSTKSPSTRQPKNRRRDDSSDSPGSPPGVFKVTHHTLRRKEQKEKVYKCGQCKQKTSSMKELKQHYAKKHQKVLCSICNRTFDSDILLARHNYTHYDKRFFCKKCKEGFYFASELKKHKVSHAKTPSFQCMVAGCGKWFKRVAEVNVHMEIHKNKTWNCSLCKTFSTTCEKYLKDHIRTDHNPKGLPYGCSVCGKGFKYRMQLKRHNSDKNLCSGP